MSAALLATMRSVPGVVDVDTNLIEGKPELGTRIDRAKAADLGVNVQDGGPPGRRGDGGRRQ